MKDTSHKIDRLKLNLKMFDFTKESSWYTQIEEPVSPPACDPDEGPPLIFMQSIEDIASEVVDENRMFKKIEKTNILQKDEINFNIPKVVQLAERNPFSSLIPATVSEISEDPKPYAINPPPTLHMSGGMVSTDMTLHMASVPTSVITPNTAIENRPDKDEAIDNIFEYFMCGTGDNIRYVREPESQRMMKKHSNTPHEICPNLPLDLSVAKIQEESKLVSRKRRREETIKEQEICIAKRSFTSSTETESELKMEEKNRLLQDCEGVTKEEEPVRKQLLRNNQVVDESAVNIKDTATNKDKSAVENTEKENNVACRLVLPKRKDEKARIVFTNGMFVEIDREMFKNLEQNNAKEKKLECHKTPPKTAKTGKHVNTAQIRRKKLKKQNSTVHPVKNTIHAQGESSGCVENCDITLRDMPMIITNDNEENQGTSKKDEKLTNQIQINVNNMTPPPTPPPSISMNFFLPNSTPLNSFPLSLSPASSLPPSTLSFPTPPPSNPCSPPGLHKLPSIVSKPSYYAKCEGRKVLKTK